MSNPKFDKASQKIVRKLQSLRNLIIQRMDEFSETIDEEELLSGKTDIEILEYQEKKFQKVRGLKNQNNGPVIKRNSKRGNIIVKQGDKVGYRCYKCLDPEQVTFESLQALGGHHKQVHRK